MTPPGLERRPLGRTDITVTPLGLGGAYLGRTYNSDGQWIDDTDVGIATVLRALELGIRLIDTSAAYMGGSRSETLIGQALGQWFANGGSREALVLSTKTGTRDRSMPHDERYTGDATWRSIETSLSLLGVGYLDVALVHDPHDLTPVLAPGGAWEALKAMRAQGIVRAIGLGVRNHAFHRALMETGDLDVSLTHSDFNLLTQSAVTGVLEPAAAHGAGVFNATSLYHGLLGGEDPLTVAERMAPHAQRHPEWLAQLTDAAQRGHALWAWCRDWGIDLMALNLQFCAREPRITATLMGAATPEQIETDVAAMLTEIPDAVWAELPERLYNGRH